MGKSGRTRSKKHAQAVQDGSQSHTSFQWKRNVLAHAIAVAGAGVPGLASACLTTPLTGARTTTCILADGESLSVTSTGSIVTTGGENAVQVTSSATGVTISNDGAISSENSGGVIAINGSLNDFDGSLANTGSITATGTVSEGVRAAAAVRLQSLTESGSVTNSGTVEASMSGGSGTGLALGVTTVGDLEGTLNNSGTVSADAEVAVGSATAIAQNVSTGGDLGGVTETATVTNSGILEATASVETGDAVALGSNTSGDLEGALDNSGSVVGSAAVGSGEAIGVALRVNGNVTETGTVTNSGTLEATASAVSGTAGAAGFNGNGDLGGTLDNSGSVSANATADDEANAYGIRIRGQILGEIPAIPDNPDTTGTDESVPAVPAGSLTNSGSVSATATVTGSEGSAFAAGIDVSEGVAGNLSNTGSVSATATAANGFAFAEALGVDDVAETGTVSNSDTGTLEASASVETGSAIALGLEGEDVAGALDNAGTVSATSTVGDGFAAAAAVLLGDVEQTGSVTNSGALEGSASAESGAAFGLGLIGNDVEGALDNTGSITASATGGGETGSEAFALAVGVLVDDVSGTLSNSGSVTADASAVDGAFAVGIEGDDIQGTVDNSGTVSATATGDDDSEALGIRFAGGIQGEILPVPDNPDTTGTDESVPGVAAGSLVNSGSVSATASGEEDAFAVGVEVEGGLRGGALAVPDDPDTTGTDESVPAIAGGSLSNTGTIEATASVTGDDATAVGLGMFGNFEGSAPVSGVLSNSGSISADASAGDDDAFATGVVVEGSVTEAGSIDNSGTIEAKADAEDEDAEAYGVIVGDVDGAFDNSGSVTADADAYSEASAHGVNTGDVGGTVTNSGTIEADADAEYESAYAYGVITGDIGGGLDNSGSVTADANASSEASAYALILDDVDGSVTNTGSITAEAVANFGDADAYGIEMGDLAGTLDNSAEISADAKGSYAYAAGIELSEIEAGGALINSGSITVSAGQQANVLFSVEESYEADAVGIDVTEGDVSGALENSGAISVTAHGMNSADAWGIYIEDSIEAGGSLTNTGSISASASGGYYAEAKGIEVEDDVEGGIAAVPDNPDTTGTDESVPAVPAGTVVNTGSVTATAVTTDYSHYEGGAYAEGIEVDDLDGGSLAVADDPDTTETDESAPAVPGGSLDNSGTVIATATGAAYAEATGIDVDGDIEDVAWLSNSGTVTATATSLGADSEAIGIEVEDDVEDDASLTNSGSVTATASSSLSNTGILEGHWYVDADATGIRVDESLRDQATLTNSGSISATATADVTAEQAVLNVIDGDIHVDADATGIYIEDFGSSVDETEAGATLTNTASGSISASATGLHDVEAKGIEIDDDGIEEGSTLSNAGSISAVASAVEDAEAIGIEVADDFEGNMAGVLVNTGGITADASGGTEVVADGVRVGGFEGHVDGDLTNTGTISATATGSSSVLADGIRIGDLEGSVSGLVTNTGTISASATGDDNVGAAGLFIAGTLYDGGTPAVPDNPDTTETDESVPAVVRGIVSNSGTISANVTSSGSGSAAGVFIHQMEAGSTLINEAGGTISAAISANGVSASSPAIGAGIWVNDLEAGATLTNAGTVTATSSGAHDVHWSILINNGHGNTISNSGSIIGQMNLVDTSLNNTGRVTMPVGDTGLIGGDYTQSGTGDLEIGVRSAAAGDYGRLVVSETADISANDLLAVDVSPDENLFHDDIIEDVLSGGTLVHGGGMTVSDNSLLWNFTAIDDGLNNVDLRTVKALMISETADASAPDWVKPAANALDEYVYSGNASDELVGAIAGSGDLNGASAQVVPVLAAQSANAANLSLSDASGAVIRRISSRRGMSGGDSGAEKHAWIRVFGTSSEQDDDSDRPGYEVDNQGLVIGYDQEVDDNWNLGIAFGYNKPEAESDSSLIDHEIDIDGYQLALYGDWTGSDYFVDLIAMFGQNDNESERFIRIGDLRAVAEGDYDSDYSLFYGAVGRTFEVADGVTFSPVLHAGYTKIDEDSYTETGAGELNLRVSDNDAESLVIGIDGRLAVDIGENGSQFTAHAGIGTDSSTDESTVTASLLGGGPVFRTISDEPDETVYRAGLGLGLYPTDRVQLNFTYEFEGRDDFTNQLISATLRWRL